jgi:hypothetical protein
MLADLRARADFASSRLAPVFQVLRREANGAERKQNHARADRRVTIDDDVGDQLSAVLNRYVGTDDTKWSDSHVATKNRRGIDQRGWMNGHAERPRQYNVWHRIHVVVFRPREKLMWHETLGLFRVSPNSIIVARYFGHDDGGPEKKTLEFSLKFQSQIGAARFMIIAE